tara:strand:- start:47 stop:229 length:183 start_codon:yes stop_codon:yes gene_type:complete
MDNNLCKDESLRDYLIELILDSKQGDEILIDLLHADLHDIAAKMLLEEPTQNLKDLVENL